MIYEVFSAFGNMRRKEFIDTSTNELYTPNDSAKRVEERYLAFWQINNKNRDLRCIAFPMPEVKSQGKCWGIEIKDAK